MNKEELQEKFEQLASAIDWIKTKLVDLQEEKGLAPVKTPFEVELPEDGVELYYISNIYSMISSKNINIHNMNDVEHFENGFYFETRGEAEQHLREQRLMFKIKKWAKIHNDGWLPNWYNGEKKYRIDVLVKEKLVNIRRVLVYDGLVKLPHFKTREIAQACIDEFGDEIKEVFC